MYKNSLPDVPPCFVNLVYVTLYKLVGVQLIPKDLVTPEFFTKIRVRFQNSSKKVVIMFKSKIACSVSYFFILF